MLVSTNILMSFIFLTTSREMYGTDRVHTPEYTQLYIQSTTGNTNLRKHLPNAYMLRSMIRRSP